MKVLIVNTFDRDGGAARSARRLHLALRNIGVDSRMLVLHKTGEDPHTLVVRDPYHRLFSERFPLLDALPLLAYPRREVTHWSNTLLPGSIDSTVQEWEPDLVHIHWINRGMLSVKDLPRWNTPVVWTLHDHWAFTGGCHYPAKECDRYKQACGACPALGSQQERDLSRWNWKRKRDAWQDMKGTVIGPSRWLTQRASESSLLGDWDCRALPNAIDTELYTPGNREAARKALGLPLDKPLVLMVAMNPDSDRNKGGHLALEAITHAARILGKDAADVLIAGEQDGPDKPTAAWAVHRMGVITEEEKMVLLYQAADVQVVPSYYENLSNAIMEACSCGVPCVAFRAGGNGDMILHQETGWLAEPYDPSSLAEGLVQFLRDPELRGKTGDAARKHILTFSRADRIARRHLDLYTEVLS